MIIVLLVCLSICLCSRCMCLRGCPRMSLALVSMRTVNSCTREGRTVWPGYGILGKSALLLIARNFAKVRVWLDTAKLAVVYLRCQ